MSDYSVVISTFLRPIKLEKCLQSILQIPISFGPNQVVVADDGEANQKKDQVYENYSDELPLSVVDLSYDTGLAKKRNEGLERIDDEFILFLDDDQYVPSDVHELTTILDENPQLGAIAPFWAENGLIKCNAANFHIKRGWVIKRGDTDECEQTGTGHHMFRYDHISNAAMFRTAVFDDYTWDGFYTIGEEDTDFYLYHKELDKWDFAATPDYIIRHDPGAGTVGMYDYERNDIKKFNESMSYLSKKFDIKGVIHESSHHHPTQPLLGRLAHWIATNLIPNSVLWSVRRQRTGFYIIDHLFPNQ